MPFTLKAVFGDFVQVRKKNMLYINGQTHLTAGKIR